MSGNGSLPNISAEQITTYSNYVLIAIIVFIFLGALIGFIKGFWKSGFKMFITIGLFALAIFLNQKITFFIYELDLSFLSSWGVPIESLGGMRVYEIVESYIVNALNTTNVTMDPAAQQSILELASAIGLSIASLVIFIVDIVLIIFILAPIISFILYHFAFKFFISKKTRKKKKMRFLGALTGAVTWGVCFCLLLSPFTAIINSLGKALHTYDDQRNSEISNNETYDYLMDLIEGYDNSYLSQMLVSITLENGKTVDVSLLEYVTNTKYKDYEINFTKELANIFEIAVAVVDSGAIQTDLTFKATSLLSDTFVNYTLNALSRSGLLMNVLPIAMMIAINSDAIKSNIDMSDVNIDNIDFTNDVQAIADLYSALYKTGYINQMVEGSFTLENFTLRRSEQKDFDAAFDKLDSITLLNEIMPYIMAALNTNQSLIDSGMNILFTGDVNYYKTIDWGNEMKILYHAMLDISEMYLDYYQEELKFNQNNFSKLLNPLLAENNVLVAQYKKGTQEIEKYIPGKTKFIINGKCTSNGVDYEGQSSVCSKESDDYDPEAVYEPGLLDIKLFNGNLSNLLDFLLNVEQIQSFINQDIVDDVKSTLVTTEDWKAEFSGILDCTCLLVNNEKIDIAAPDSIDFTDPIIRDELKRIIIRIDEDENMGYQGSTLFTKLIPNILSTALDDQDDFELFGLTLNDFDFEQEQLGHEIVNIIDLMGEGMSLMKDFSVENLKTVDLDNMLTKIYESKIINPDKVVGDAVVKNTNFKLLLEGIFKDGDADRIEGISISRETIDSIGDDEWVIYDQFGNKSGEITAVCHTIDTILNSESLSAIIEGGNNLNIEDIDGDELEEVIIAVSDSKLLEPSLVGLMNTMVSNNINQMLGTTGIVYDETTDWHEEAYNLKQVINSYKAIVASVGSSAEIDWLSLEAEQTRNLLYALYDTELLQPNKKTGKDSFGDIVYQLIDDNISSIITLTDLQKEQIKNDIHFEIRPSVSNDAFWAPTDNQGKVLRDNNGNVIEGENKSEIYKLSLFIEELNGLDSNTPAARRKGQINIDNVSFEELENLLYIANDSYILRTLLPALLVDQFNSNAVTMEGIDIKKAYIEIFDNEFNYQNASRKEVNTREEELAVRKAEIKKLVGLVNEIQDIQRVLEDATLSGINKFKDQATRDSLESLLNNSHDSRIMNATNKLTSPETELTLFEEIVNMVLDKSSLLNISYDKVNNPYQQSFATAEDYMKNILLNVRNKVDGRSWKDTQSGILVVEGEISRLLNIVNTVVSIEGLDISNLESAKNINGDQANQILSVVNESYLAHDLVPNLVREILIESMGKLGIEEVKVKNHGDYFCHDYDDAQNVLLPFETRIMGWETEIDIISKLFDDVEKINEVLNDPSEGAIKFKEKTALLQKAFEGLYDSKILSSTRKLTTIKDLTLFEEVIKIVLDQAMITDLSYDVANPGQSSTINKDDHMIETILTIRNSDEFVWKDVSATRSIVKEGEISKLINIISVIADSDLNISSMEDAKNLSSEDIKKILYSINTSYLAHDIVPSMVKEVLIDSLSSLGINEESLKSNGDYYQFDYNYSQNKRVDFVDSVYQWELEIAVIADLFNQTKDLQDVFGKNAGISSFTKETIGKLKTLLNELYDSKIMTSEDRLSSIRALTPYEEVINKLLVDSTLADIAFDESNPNITDGTATDYAITRILTLRADSNLNYKDIINVNGFINEGEITKLMNVIEVTLDVAPNISSAEDAKTLSSTQIKSLLTVLNESYLVHDSVPSMVKEALVSSLSGLGINEIRLNNNGDYYQYDYDYDQNRAKEFNDSVALWEEEIGIIADLFDQTKDLQSIFGQASGMTAFQGENLNKLELLLNGLYDSKIMTSSNRLKNSKDLTPFEEVINKLLIDSSLANISFDASNPNTTDSTSSENAITKIVALRNEPTLDYKDKVVNGFVQEGEISKLMNIIEVAAKNSANIDSADGITSLTTSQVKSLLNAFNESYLAHDSVASMVKNILSPVTSKLKVNNLESDREVDFYSIDYNRTENKPIAFASQVQNWEKEIEIITNIYDVFGGNIDNLTEFDISNPSNNMVSTIFLNVKRSLLFEPAQANFVYFLFNKAGLSKYISQFGIKEDYNSSFSEDELANTRKRDTIDYLVTNRMGQEDDWRFEGQQLDAFISQLNTYSGNIDKDDSGFATFIYNMIVSSYVAIDEDALSDGVVNSRRAYLFSEVVSEFLGILTNNNCSVGNEVDLKHGTATMNDLNLEENKYAYNKLNLYEAKGIKGLYNFYQGVVAFKNRIGLTLTKSDVIAFKTAIAESTALMGPGENTYLDKTKDSQNSDLAYGLYTHFIDESIGTIKFGLFEITLNAPDRNKAPAESFIEVGQEWINELTKIENTLFY